MSYRLSLLYKSELEGSVHIMSTLFIIINLVVFVLALIGLWWMAKKHIKFPKRVFLALGLGIVLGLILHLTYGSSSKILSLIHI